ncbi:MAG TPA: hypothetical protein VMB48_12390 [Steroidobacteraceae bacterium]|nr:hypothetical protein [Steroidobacteraceae bacterium]
MDEIFHRPKLALDMASLLLRPTSLQTRIRSGLFISAPRQTGKSTFLTRDLIPTLESAGAITLYIDLWRAAGRTTAEKLLGAVQKKLAQLELEGPQSFTDRARKLLMRIGLTSAEVDGAIEVPVHLVKAKARAKVKFDFDAGRVGEKGGASLSDALLELSRKTGRDIVFIVDEVQELKMDGYGKLIMKELKAVRDEINGQPGDHGYFIFVGNGSHRSAIHEMTAQRREPFYGAEDKRLPELDQGYVSYVLARAAKESPSVVLPTAPAAFMGFRVLGYRPGMLQSALEAMQRTQSAAKSPDAVFDGIVNTLHEQDGLVELEKLRLLGELPQAVFARICRGPESGVTGLYAGDALTAYATALGWEEVTTREVQLALDSLKASNLVMRDGDGGPVLVTNDSLREIWLRHHQHGESDIDRSAKLGAEHEPPRARGR